MDPQHLFMDDRLTGMCVYCGAHPDTRDHVPSKVLLDEPFPPQLPVVGSRASCNGGFSRDEQYLACFLECVICGTVEPSGLQRLKIKRILDENPTLKSRIEASQRKDKMGNLLWQPELGHSRRILTKLARGHVAYELYPKLEDPDVVVATPLLVLSNKEKIAFEDTLTGNFGSWPELGDLPSGIVPPAA